MLPIIMLVGQAGSGKDTVADILCKEFKGLRISLADPIKQFASGLGFSQEQLYGPSETRSQYILNPFYKRRFEPGELWMPDLSVTAHINGTAWASKYYGQLVTDPEVPIREWFHKFFRDKQTFSAREVLQSLGTEGGRHLNPHIWIEPAIDRALQALDRHNLVVISDGRFRNEIVATKIIGGKIIKLQTQQVSTSTHASETEQTSIPDFWFDRVYQNRMDGLDRLKADVVSFV